MQPCCEKKKLTGAPLKFTRVDMYKMCLEQHRYTVAMNDERDSVVLGSRRCGILSRRPLRNGEVQNVDDEVLAAVHAGNNHWSCDAHRRPVTTGSTRMKSEWIRERHTLPLVRPTYDNPAHEADYDIDYGPAPHEDPLATDDCVGVSCVDDSFVGADMLRRRIEQTADRLSRTMKSDLDQRTERAKRRLSTLGACTCKNGASGYHTDKCPQTYWARYNALVLLKEQERQHEKQLAVVRRAAEQTAAKRRSDFDDEIERTRPGTDVGRIAGDLRERLSEFRSPTDVLVPIGVKLWGSDVLSISASGKARMDQYSLPLVSEPHRRTWIIGRLAEAGINRADLRPPCRCMAAGS